MVTNEYNSHMKLKIEIKNANLTDLSRCILETALTQLFSAVLDIALSKLKIVWTAAQGSDDTLSVNFIGAASLNDDSSMELRGKAILDGDTLKGFNGVYSIKSPDRQEPQKDFNLKISPLASLWINSAARDNSKAPAPEQETPQPEPKDDGEWPDELFDDSLFTPQEMFNFPYELNSVGQMEFFINNLVSCMERTIIEMMDSQKKFLDRIDIPDTVCPGIKGVYLKPADNNDILYVDTTVEAITGPTDSEYRFFQLSVDTAADITRYVLTNYSKQPLLPK